MCPHGGQKVSKDSHLVSEILPCRQYYTSYLKCQCTVFRLDVNTLSLHFHSECVVHVNCLFHFVLQKYLLLAQEDSYYFSGSRQSSKIGIIQQLSIITKSFWVKRANCDFMLYVLIFSCLFCMMIWNVRLIQFSCPFRFVPQSHIIP